MPQFVTDLLAFFAADGWFLTQVNNLKGILEGVFQYLPAIILIALGLVVLFLGKKILPVEKFLLFLGAGFVVGFQLLAPLVCGWLQWEQTNLTCCIFGGVVGLIAALLFKFLYILLVIGAFGGGAFAGTYFLIENVEALKNAVSSVSYLNYIIAGVVAVIVLLLAWWLLKYIEMLVTSIIGAGAVVLGARMIYDFRSVINIGTLSVAGYELAWISLAFIAVIALVGFVVQIKTRRLY